MKYRNRVVTPRGLEPDDGNYVGNLSPQWPLDEELISQGDDHVRAMSRALKNSFPNFEDDAVKLTAAEIDDIALGTNYLGTITFWDGTVETIPLGHFICDGGTYAGYKTPNLIGKYIRGGIPDDIDDEGGQHEFTVTAVGSTPTLAEMPSHRHSFLAHDNAREEEDNNGRDDDALDRRTYGNYPTPDEGGNQAHNHTFHVMNEPLYHTLIPIIYLGV